MNIRGHASTHPILVRVPATAGNFGGTESGAALALDASLNVKVTPRLDGRVRIRYFGEDGDRVPRDSSNLIIQAMRAALAARQRELLGADLEIYSSIPVGAGLGASAAAVWAGLIAAHSLFDLRLDEKVLFALAGTLESRRDNLYAAWFGGLAVLAERGGIYRTALVPEAFELAIVIPLLPMQARLSTGDYQPVCKADGGQDDPVRRATAVAKFFAQGACNGSFGLETAPTQDLATAVPGLAEALRISVPGLLGIFVCGSGPAVGITSQNGSSHGVDAARDCFSQHGVSTRVLELRSSSSGARDWNSIDRSRRQVDAEPTTMAAAATRHF